MVNSEQKRVLLIEDDLDYARLIQLTLEENFHDCTTCALKSSAVCDGTQSDGEVLSPVGECVRARWIVTIVDRVVEAADLLHKNSFDVILLDMFLPDAQKADAVQLIHDAAPHIPIVVQSAVADRSLIQHLMLGGQIVNYIIKGEVRSSWALKQQLCLDIDRFQVLHDYKKEVAALAS